MNKINTNLVYHLKEIFSSEWKYGIKTIYIFTLVCFGLISFYNLNIGFYMSPDSDGYSQSADVLIKLNFNLFEYFAQKTISDINPSYIYTIPVVLISLTKFIFGTEWQFSFVILNLIFIFFSLIVFIKILFLLQIRPIVISLALSILLISVDLLTWPRYILTDTIFSFLVLMGIYYIVKSIINNNVYYFSLIFVIFLIYLTRPTSIPFIFGYIFFLGALKLKKNYNPKLILIIIFTLFLLTPFAFAALYELMNKNLGTYSQVVFLTEMVKKGMIIHDRPDTWVNSPSSFFDVVHLYFTRILFFFTPYTKSFSSIHIVLNLIQTFCILLSIGIWAISKKNYDHFNKVFLLIFLISFFVSAFHAFTLIDYDWRYRFPIIIPLLIMFPISLEIFIRKFYKKIFKF